METKGELAKAIIKVMQEVIGIEKNLVVGSGQSSYKGVSDKDVKNIVGSAMAKHGLCIMPIDIESKTTIERWEETTQYGVKMKQTVFAEANCKYLLLHTSGESQVVAGLGHGVDTQDKSAGKATTYSLKNCVLAIFMIPTGEIDDTDRTHSNDLPVSQKSIVQPATKPTPSTANLELSEELKTVGEQVGLIKTIDDLSAFWSILSTEQKANSIIKNLINKRKIQLTPKV